MGVRLTDYCKGEILYLRMQRPAYEFHSTPLGLLYLWAIV